MTDPTRLLRLTDVAEALGVTVKAAWHLPRRHADFPTPRVTRGRTRLWDADEVRAWVLAHGRTWKEPEGTTTP